MRKREQPWWVALFVEALMAAIAEALVAAVGWVARKAIRRWRKRRATPDDEGGET